MESNNTGDGDGDGDGEDVDIPSTHSALPTKNAIEENERSFAKKKSLQANISSSKSNVLEAGNDEVHEEEKPTINDQQFSSTMKQTEEKIAENAKPMQNDKGAKLAKNLESLTEAKIKKKSLEKSSESETFEKRETLTEKEKQHSIQNEMKKETENKQKKKEEQDIELCTRMESITSSIQTLSKNIQLMKQDSIMPKRITPNSDVAHEGACTYPSNNNNNSDNNAEIIENMKKRENALLKRISQMVLLKDAKHLVFCSLQKGRAAELLCRSRYIHITIKTFTRHALKKLIIYTFGEEYAKEVFDKSTQNEADNKISRKLFSGASLTVFRKEQTFLLAENEKLMKEVLKLRNMQQRQQQQKSDKNIPAHFSFSDEESDDFDKKRNRKQGKESFSVCPGSSYNSNARGYTAKHYGTKQSTAEDRKCILTNMFCILTKRCQLILFSVLFKLQMHVIEENETYAVKDIKQHIDEVKRDAHKSMQNRLAVMQMYFSLKLLSSRILFLNFFCFVFRVKQLSMEREYKISMEEFKKDQMKRQEASMLFGRCTYTSNVSRLAGSRISDGYCYGIGEIEDEEAEGRTNVSRNRSFSSHVVTPLAHQPPYYNTLPSVQNNNLSSYDALLSSFPLNNKYRTNKNSPPFSSSYSVSLSSFVSPFNSSLPSPPPPPPPPPPPSLSSEDEEEGLPSCLYARDHVALQKSRTTDDYFTNYAGKKKTKNDATFSPFYSFTLKVPSSPYE